MDDQYRILSVFLNTDRTYLAIVERRERGLKLLYVNSTEEAIDIDFYDDSENNEPLTKLKDLLNNLPYSVSQVSVSLPSESLFVSQFPGKPGITDVEMKALVNIELRHNFPQFGFDEFSCSLLPLHPKLNGELSIVTVILQRITYVSCMDILKSLNLPVERIEISQLNAQNALIYNYPEYSDKSVVVFGLQNNFIDIGLINSLKTGYINLRLYQNENQIAGICYEEIEKLLTEYTNDIDAVFLYGISLTQEILTSVKESLELVVPVVKRLNAFRMFATDLSDREKEYCSRTAHIYPACIGAIIPNFQERLKLV